MKKPTSPPSLPPPPRPPHPHPPLSATASNSNPNQQQKQQQQQQRRKPPSPQELVAHYESEGMDSKEASLKVIEDLQTILLKVVGSSRGKKDKFMGDTTRKLDNINTRLAILEMKMDSKPGFPESLGIGVAAGATFKGLGTVFPHLVGAFSNMWNAVRTSTSAHRDSPSSSS